MYFYTVYILINISDVEIYIYASYMQENLTKCLKSLQLQYSLSGLKIFSTPHSVPFVLCTPHQSIKAWNMKQLHAQQALEKQTGMVAGI